MAKGIVQKSRKALFPLWSLKDTLKAFDNFKSKQQKCIK